MDIFVDSDSQLLEPNEISTDYVAAKYRDLVPQVVERNGIAYMKIEGRVSSAFVGSGANSRMKS